ncbi:TetR/AcrR family transcriptional regulator [Rhodococcus sp. D2-41]|uniref:TetR/AcrR family transcriptional regulator n=1 Tax=Speluncibacter jeojiensis TaxID=2710754 RepID=A0A9X4RFL3_9ACTN|nr:TetR/AcrR family transcriptional regulator [Rhodococcus sp. D2-41]MDG3010630.1 TetR/AcrR family transcriptional regulator [Rhodococcus sp. D2-41]MDG3016808.1 TetR/AcrR family transcriptional regulator [Corynebacteriales bacterium D3-21]
MTDSAEPSRPPMRADARRNRDAILRAADRAFSQHGVDAQMSDIAALAELGMGTVYRHFPTKEALVDALLLDHFDRAERAARQADEEPDPWAGLESLMYFMAASVGAKRYLSQFMGGRIHGSTELQERRHQVFGVLTGLVDRAKSAGQLRSDVEAGDLLIATVILARAGWGGTELADRAARRYLGIVLDGLRNPGRGTLDGTPLDQKELETLAAEVAPSEAAAFRRGQRGR